MLKKQRFGVEIEMTGITREVAANTVAKVLNSTASRAKGHPYYTRTIKDSIGREWKIMRDSSIVEEVRNGYGSDEHRVEFVTPPLNYEDIELLQEIVRELRKAGAIANSSCGIHIHVDGANHTPNSLKKLVMFMISRQDLIYEALEIGTRGTRWCRKLNAKILEELKSNKELTKEVVKKYGTAKQMTVTAAVLTTIITTRPAIMVLIFILTFQKALLNSDFSTAHSMQEKLKHISSFVLP